MSNINKLKASLKRLNKLSGFGDEVRLFHELFEEIYGYDYSDVDDDWLIDSIDYEGSVSWEKFKKHMDEINK